ncbi:MAG: sigma-54-dependent transcriptional regulator [Bdellovibrionia bacterium]
MGHRILAVDDDSLALATLAEKLKPFSQFQLETAMDGNEAISKVKSQPFAYSVIFLDYAMPGISGSQTVVELLKINPKLIIAMNSGHDAKDTIIECIRAGAVDFVLKDESTETLVRKLNSLCAKFDETARILEDSPRTSNEEKINSIGMIGKSKSFADVATIVSKAAQEECGVLIQGETGTGKELVAKAVHSLSPRRSRSFVAININSIPETLIESELFGHVKGAFTGATDNKIGKFKLADGGTLFLDEIGDLRLDLQVKLLRVLQEGEFYQVGSNKVEKVNVRIIAATHVNLLEAIKLGRFRQDLYYRLNILNIQIPSLRERPEDIRPLVLHFQKKYRATDKVFLMRTIKRMEKYNWPGNIRELENEVQKLALVGEQAISDIHLDSKFFQAENLMSREGEIQNFEELEMLRDRMEKELIEKAFKRFKKLTDAAASLNVAISTLHKKMKRLNLTLEDLT